MSNYYALVRTSNGWLMHHGVPSMRWGVRHDKDTSGGLSDRQKKRISKKYKKYQSAGDRDMTRDYQKLYVTAYNKTADKENNGLISKFNKSQEKKYGKNYTHRKGYVEDYTKTFNRHLSKALYTELNSYRRSNKNYNKAKDLVKQYDMTKWDDLAKKNSEGIEYIKAHMG